jgi:hypothetical protein
MLVPTSEQWAKASNGYALPVQGAHTVGAPDGSPGLSVTNWSLRHGDLRISHFLGLHALQFLPLVYVLFFRKRPEPQKRQAVNAVAASYMGLVGLLFWQALRGQSILMPDGWTFSAFSLWALITLGMLVHILRNPQPAVAAHNQEVLS